MLPIVSFSHDPDHRFGPGAAHQDPSPALQGLLNRFDPAPDPPVVQEVPSPPSHDDASEDLRAESQSGGQPRQRTPFQEQHLSHLQGGQDTVSRQGVLSENDVARRLSPQSVSSLHHGLQDVSVSDPGPDQADAQAGQGGLESQVGHDGGDDPASGQAVSFQQVPGQNMEDVIPGQEPPAVIGQDGAVGVSVEGRAEVGPLFHHGTSQPSGDGPPRSPG